MKLLYKPFGIVAGLFAGIVAKKLFEAVWGIFDNEEPPKATTLQTTWPKVIGAAAMEGVAFKVTRAAVNRAGAKSFEHLTGFWPGETVPEKSQAAALFRQKPT
jgi:Protein of unknown function (DUF4235)